MNGFDAAYAFGCYEGRLRTLIQVFKYGKIPTLAEPLGGMLAAALPREHAFDAIVPMPMHWRRRWSRGFNQADLLARVLGRRLGLRVEPVARRRKATPPQAGLTAHQRRLNMSGVFAVRRPDAIRAKRILLVDDVFTTGATAAACARALKRSGAAYVAVLTVARTDRRIADHAAVIVSPRFATPSPGSLLDAKPGSIA